MQEDSKILMASKTGIVKIYIPLMLMTVMRCTDNTDRNTGKYRSSR